MKHLQSTIVLFLYVSIISLKAQTTVPAGNVSGTWTKVGSPYKVQGEIVVPVGSTLTLQPGTTIEFGGMYGLTVDGILKAQGAKGDSITFTAATGKTWAGILYNRNTQTDTIRFNYCKWVNVGEGRRKYKSQQLYVRGIQIAINKALLVLRSSPLEVKNASFNFTRGDSTQAGLIVSLKSSYVRLDSIGVRSSANTISTNTDPFFLDSIPNFSIQNMDIANIKAGFSGINIDASKGGAANHLNIFKNIRIINCPKTLGFFISNSNYCIIDNFYMDNGLWGGGLGNCRNLHMINSQFKNSNIGISAAGDMTGSIVENCLFEHCGDMTQSPPVYSLNLQSSGLLFYNCQFKNSNEGIWIGQDNGNGTPWFLNCAFINSAERAATIEGFPVFINCNIQNNTNKRTFAGYYPPYFGGVVVTHESNQSKPYFYNCLMWGNYDTVGHHTSIVLSDHAVQTLVDHCFIQGDSSSGIVGFDADGNRKVFYIPSSQLTYTNSSGHTPEFVDSANGNYNIVNSCSQVGYAINRGMNGNLLNQYPYNTLYASYGINIYEALDLNGNPRVMDDTIDIGCYESSGTKKALKLHTNPNDTILCFGGKASYTATHYGTVQQYHWQKKTGSNIADVGTNRSITIPPASPVSGSSQYRLLANNTECLNLKDSTRWFTVTVNSPAKKGIIKIPNVDTIMLKDSVRFSTASTGFGTIQWNNSKTGNILRLKGADLGALGKHMITVEATDNNGCIARDTAYIVTKENVGIKNILSQTLKIYPQPATNTLNIASEIPLSGMIVVVGMDGRLLIQQPLSEALTTIDLSALQSGIYILNIKTCDGLLLAKTILKD